MAKVINPPCPKCKNLRVFWGFPAYQCRETKALYTIEFGKTHTCEKFAHHPEKKK